MYILYVYIRTYVCVHVYTCVNVHIHTHRVLYSELWSWFSLPDMMQRISDARAAWPACPPPSLPSSFPPTVLSLLTFSLVPCLINRNPPSSRLPSPRMPSLRKNKKKRKSRRTRLRFSHLRFPFATTAGEHRGEAPRARAPRDVGAHQSDGKPVAWLNGKTRRAAPYLAGLSGG